MPTGVLPEFFQSFSRAFPDAGPPNQRFSRVFSAFYPKTGLSPVRGLAAVHPGKAQVGAKPLPPPNACPEKTRAMPNPIRPAGKAPLLPPPRSDFRGYGLTASRAYGFPCFCRCAFPCSGADAPLYSWPLGCAQAALAALCQRGCPRFEPAPRARPPANRVSPPQPA